jgi:hypothetical protein
VVIEGKPNFGHARPGLMYIVRQYSFSVQNIYLLAILQRLIWLLDSGHVINRCCNPCSTQILFEALLDFNFKLDDGQDGGELE